MTQQQSNLNAGAFAEWSGHAVVIALLMASVGCVSSGVQVPLPPGSRSAQEIQLGFERGMAKFQAVRAAYQSEYPDTPTQTIFLTFTIAPDGSMVECAGGSRNTAPSGLTRVIAEQAMALKFGARDVPPFRYENLPVVLRYDEPSSTEGGRTP